MSRRWRIGASWPRKRYFEPPWGSAPTPPSQVPQVRAGRRLRGLVVRRGRFFGVVPARASAPPAVVHTRRAVATARHAKFLFVPAQQSQAGPAPLVPSVARQNRRPSLPLRRGEFFTVPPAPQAAPPSFIPRQGRRGAVRSTLIRRGEFLIVPPRPAVAGTGPLAPKLLRQASRRLVVTRRGEFLAVPLAGAAIPEDDGFLCQDLGVVATLDAYGGSATPDAYSVTVTVDTYSATATVDSYSATAHICGR
jgi:hypothetical protein